MSAIANTFFEVKNSNITFDGMQNVTGTFVDGSSDPDICPAGFLVTPKEPLPCAGYTGINNGNAYIFQAATNGQPAADGVAPEIYAFNSYDAQILSSQSGNNYYIGAETAGLSLPAGENGTFTRIIPGEIYRFGTGNFQTAPSSLPTDCYCTIANGLLVASSSAFTAGKGLVFQVIGKAAENYTVGTWNGGQCYRVKALYAAPTGAGG